MLTVGKSCVVENNVTNDDDDYRRLVCGRRWTGGQWRRAICIY